jgi:hypothetical protein
MVGVVVREPDPVEAPTPRLERRDDRRGFGRVDHGRLAARRAQKVCVVVPQAGNCDDLDHRDLAR